MRGRVDLRVPVSTMAEWQERACRSRDGPPVAVPLTRPSCHEALVVTAGGVPPATWDTDFAFPALVSLIHRPRRPAPCRVMGIWPDAGVQHTVEIDLRLLDRVARRVVAAAMAMNRPGDVADYPEARSDLAASRSARAALPSGFPAAVSGISSDHQQLTGHLVASHVLSAMFLDGFEGSWRRPVGDGQGQPPAHRSARRALRRRWRRRRRGGT